MLWKHFEGSRFDLWIKVAVDPVEIARGFSIVGREMRVIGYAPVEGEMIDHKGRKMQGKCWQVRADEVFRTIPELRHFEYARRYQTDVWLFPVELCETFPRPRNFLESQIRDVNLLQKKRFKPPGVT